MFPNHSLVNRKRQQGSALAIAVFVVVVMTMLTVAISRNISASSDQSVQEVLGTRALMAAESGNEIALSALFPIATGAPAVATDCSAVNRSIQYFNNTPGLANCVVTTTSCDEQTNGSDTYFRIQSRGVCKASLQNNAADGNCNNTDQVCVSRQLEVEAKTQ